MITGFWTTQLIYVAAKLKIADLLKDGPVRVSDLAESAGVLAPLLYRVLRTLASVGVFTEVEPGRFALTPLAECLRSDVAGSLRARAIISGEKDYHAWGALLRGLETGEIPFEHVFGMGHFEYLTANPEIGAHFNDTMTGFATEFYRAVVEAYDFSSFRKIVDVGGGHGTLLALILNSNPNLRGVVLDSPRVAEGARELMAAANLADRCECVAGDFFQAVPGGVDACILSHIIHDWDDAESLCILRHCHRALNPGGKLLLVEKIIPPGDEPALAKLMDIHMFVLTAGRERTEGEYRALLTAAGFQLTRVMRTKSLMSVMEGVQIHSAHQASPLPAGHGHGQLEENPEASQPNSSPP